MSDLYEPRRPPCTCGAPYATHPPERSLYPTPTRLALLAAVDAGNVVEDLRWEGDPLHVPTLLLDRPDPPRKVTGRVAELCAAGWIRLPEPWVDWRLTDLGRLVLDGGTPPPTRGPSGRPGCTGYTPKEEPCE